MRPKGLALLSQENRGRFPAFCHGSSLAQCRTARATAASCGLSCSPAAKEQLLRERRERPHGARGASELPGPRLRFAAVEDHKDIYSRTHSEESVEFIEQATVGPQTWHGSRRTRTDRHPRPRQTTDLSWKGVGLLGVARELPFVGRSLQRGRRRAPLRTRRRPQGDRL